LRDEKLELTQNRILDAVEVELDQGGWFAFNLASVAKRAGVSERTVYRHFSDREFLIEAADKRFLKRMPDETELHVPEDIPKVVRRLFPMFDGYEPLMRARLSTETGRQERIRGRRKRARKLDKVLEPILKGLSPLARRQALGIIHLLCSSESWRVLKEESGFTGAQSAEAVAWAITVLMDSLKGGDRRLESGSPVPQNPVPQGEKS
jgi:AcrR family transcriptional regulator